MPRAFLEVQLYSQQGEAARPPGLQGKQDEHSSTAPRTEFLNTGIIYSYAKKKKHRSLILKVLPGPNLL